jgi:DNA-binding transcriptional LysR family regulator
MAAAARSLSYTHSAISQQLSVLEREAGTPVLEKTGRGVRLTSAGENLVRHVESILAIMERAEAELASMDDAVRGPLSLASFGTVSRVIVPDVIARLTHEHPALRITFTQLEPGEALVWLASRKVDVVLADSYPGASRGLAPGLSAQFLGEDPVRVYVPSQEPGEVPHPPGDLLWVLEPPGAASREWAERACREAGFEPVVAYESADLLFHMRMVERGLAAAFLPDVIVREFGSHLTPAAILTREVSRTIHLVTREGYEERPAVYACVDAFRDVLVGSATRQPSRGRSGTR